MIKVRFYQTENQNNSVFHKGKKKNLSVSTLDKIKINKNVTLFFFFPFSYCVLIVLVQFYDLLVLDIITVLLFSTVSYIFFYLGENLWEGVTVFVSQSPENCAFERHRNLIMCLLCLMLHASLSIQVTFLCPLIQL